MKLILINIALFSSVFSDECSDPGSDRRLLQSVPLFPAVTSPKTPLAPVATMAPEPTHTEKICSLPCTTPVNCASSCAHQIEFILSPPNSFTMECTAIGSCAQSQFTIVYPPNPLGGPITELDSIKVDAAFALDGSTITIDSRQANKVKVKTIECGAGNCAGATFVFVNADYGDIKCNEVQHGGCGEGCLVEFNGNPAVSCDVVSTASTTSHAAVATQPVTPIVPVATMVPVITAPLTPLPPITEKICNLPCTTAANCPSTCAQRIESIESPANSFTMECTAIGSCAQSKFTIVYPPNPLGAPITELDSIKVGAAFALYGSTVTIESRQADAVKVIAIECGPGNCAGAKFVFVNADYGDIKCNEVQYGGCGQGCLVEFNGDPAVSCDLVSAV